MSHRGKCNDYNKDEAEFYRLESEKACIRDLKSKEVKSKELVLDGVNVNQLLAGSISTSAAAQLDPVTCNPNSILGEFTPKFLSSYHVDKRVFDMMLQTAQHAVYDEPPEAEGLQYRLTQGRIRLCLPEPSKVRLVGSMTFAPWVLSYPNDPSKSDFINYNTNITWNLLCANTQQYIDGYKPNQSTVSVFAQYGYIDKVTGICKCEILNLGNKQFDPTIDYRPTTDPSNSESWGEQFKGNKVIDTGIIDLMIENMPNPNATGGIQVLYFAEQDIQILRLNSCVNPQNRVNTSIVGCEDNCTANVTSTNNVNTTVGRRVVRSDELP